MSNDTNKPGGDSSSSTRSLSPAKTDNSDASVAKAADIKPASDSVGSTSAKPEPTKPAPNTNDSGSHTPAVDEPALDQKAGTDTMQENAAKAPQPKAPAPKGEPMKARTTVSGELPDDPSHPSMPRGESGTPLKDYPRPYARVFVEAFMQAIDKQFDDYKKLDRREKNGDPIYPRYASYPQWVASMGQGGSIELNQAFNRLTDAAQLIETYFGIAADEALAIDLERARVTQDLKDAKNAA